MASLVCRLRPATCADSDCKYGLCFFNLHVVIFCAPFDSVFSRRSLSN